MAPLSKIISLVCEKPMANIRADTIGEAAVFVLGIGQGPYIEELASWHASHVNPKNLAASPKWFGDVS